AWSPATRAGARAQGIIARLRVQPGGRAASRDDGARARFPAVAGPSPSGRPPTRRESRSVSWLHGPATDYALGRLLRSVEREPSRACAWSAEAVRRGRTLTSRSQVQWSARFRLAGYLVRRPSTLLRTAPWRRALLLALLGIAVLSALAM